jgi:glutamate-ammonia-ligase adenylyltransferase
MKYTNEPDLERLRAGSGYLATLLKNEQMVHWLVQERNLWRNIPLPELYRDLNQLCGGCRTFKDLALAFRSFKQRHFLRLAGRDLFGLAPFSQIVAQISDLARTSLQVGLQALASRPELWMPASALSRTDAQELSRHLGILGLGKLGGGELNFVSDIDLIFLRDSEEGETAAWSESKTGLSRLAQTLTRLMAESVDGDRVFVVDMRLRPGGKDGELVVSVDRALDHYQVHGRSWERQALLKARPVAGQRSIGHSFLDQVRPFVFRRFLDFQALDELRVMRDRMLNEARDMEPRTFDLKMGWGGIREIEFVAQSLQLVYGGRYPELDEANTLRCLHVLRELDLMPDDAVASLSSAYVLLRRTEHWVQLDRNRQNHVLPRSEEDMDRLAVVLNFASGRELALALQGAREEVHRQFTALFRPTSPSPANGGLDRGHSEQGSIAHQAVPCPPFSREVQMTMQGVMNRLGHTARQSGKEEWGYRLTELIHKAGLRPGLVVLVNENPVWLEELFFSTAVSQFVASLLLHQPSLIEGLPRKKDAGLKRAWHEQARRIVRRERGYEQSLEWIRRLKNERMLNLALEDIHGRLTLGELESSLTAVADWVLQVTWETTVGQYLPQQDVPVAILGLGKLGSMEMGYLSDLDLMFVYDPAKEAEEHIPPQVVKLIQRFMRMLRTPLQEGPGYAVDAQIRPSGNYGPLIVTRSRWVDYYQQEADIWEIQALLRMRAVAGNMDLGRLLEAEARKFCLQTRSQSRIWNRLCHLRGRMERERSRETPWIPDIKLGPGGLADVEFLVQGAELVQGRERQQGALGVRELLDEFGPGLGLDTATIAVLQNSYQSLRSLELRFQLMTNHTSSVISRETFNQLQQSGLWPPGATYVSIHEWSDIQVSRRKIREVWAEVCAEEL